MKAMLKNLYCTFTFGKSKLQVTIEVAIFVSMFFLFFVTAALNYIYPWNLINTVLYVIAGVLILVWAFLYKKIVVDYFFILLVVFNVIIFASSLINGVVYFDTTVFFLSATCFIFYQIFRHKEYRDILLHIFGLAGACFLFYFIAYYFDDILLLNGERIGSDFGDLNVVGYVFLYFFCYYIYAGLLKRRWWNLLFALIAFILISITGSRSALLISLFIVILAIFLFFGREKLKWSLLISVVAILCFVCILFLPPFENIRERFLNSFAAIFSLDIVSSYEPRLFLFLEGIEFSLKRPFFGYGGVFSFGNYSFSGHFVHDNIIELWFNYGFLEVVIFQLLIFVPALKVLSKKGLERKLLLMFAMAIFLIQFFYSNYTIKIDYIILTCMMGIANENDGQIFAISFANNIPFYKKESVQI